MSKVADEVPASQRAELDRRLAAFEHDRKGAISWDALKAELQARS